MQHPLHSIKELAKLERKKYRDEHGIYLIEGKKILSEARKSGAHIEQILVTDTFSREQREFLEAEGLGREDVTTIAEHNAQRLADTETPQGIFAVVRKPVVTLDDLLQCDFLPVFENIRDPGNMGTMIRTADWFGVKGMIVTGTGVDPYHPKVVRGSMGSIFHLKVFSSNDLVADLEALKKQKYTIVVTRPEEQKEQFSRSSVEKMCLVLGNESLGTSGQIDRLADASYAIKKLGQAESLNVAVSFGIMLNELVK